ncbi:MAG: helix-turn-helix domain-containing protein [Sumerlaeia bacterium]
MEHSPTGFISGAKRTHWQAAVDQQMVSGLSAAAFCREQGLSYQSFISWRKRFATEGRGDVEHDRQGGRIASEAIIGEKPFV